MGLATDLLNVYPNSISESRLGKVFMADLSGQDVLVAGKHSEFIGERAVIDGEEKTIAALSHQNACVLRQEFKFTAPVPILKERTTFGVGDRLGIATDGHLRAFKKFEEIYPVLAQQSIRELTLTNRSFEEIIDSASFAVFRNGFTRGFGADGDHLKTFDEIRMALDSGCSMITLDCSDHLNNQASELSNDQIGNQYVPNERMESVYIGKEFKFPNLPDIVFSAENLKRIFLLYGKAIIFIERVYDQFFSHQFLNLDFEISIDETKHKTSLLEHFFIANELASKGIKFSSLAPRFVGEFQKGIDYVGSVGEFESEFKWHAELAKNFGYKLSIHSGSDKFSVFPIIGKYTNGNYHIKTSGTNWLEAMRVVARYAPSLFREIYKFALTVFIDAKKNYVVSTEMDNVPDIDRFPDSDLGSTLDINEARQLIHITYGQILNKKSQEEQLLFKDRLFQIWKEKKDAYSEILEKHISNHILSLQSMMH